MRYFKVAELPDIERAIDVLNYLLWDSKVYNHKAENLDQKIDRARDGLMMLDQELSADTVDGSGK